MADFLLANVLLDEHYSYMMSFLLSEMFLRARLCDRFASNAEFGLARFRMGTVLTAVAGQIQKCKIKIFAFLLITTFYRYNLTR